jgi:hypothetical protein
MCAPQALLGDVTEAKAARALVQQRAAILDAVYTTCAGPVDDVATSGLALVDFTHCLHACGLAHAYIDAGTCRKVFGDTMAASGVGALLGDDGGGGGGGSDALLAEQRMSRAAFSLALVRLAIHKVTNTHTSG